jgi:hypothetical protein
MSHLQSLIQHLQLLQPNLSQRRAHCSVLDIISFNTHAILSALQVPAMFSQKSPAPLAARFRIMGACFCGKQPSFDGNILSFFKATSVHFGSKNDG